MQWETESRIYVSFWTKDDFVAHRKTIYVNYFKQLAGTKRHGSLKTCQKMSNYKITKLLVAFSLYIYFNRPPNNLFFSDFHKRHNNFCRNSILFNKLILFFISLFANLGHVLDFNNFFTFWIRNLFSSCFVHTVFFSNNRKNRLSKQLERELKANRRQ